MISFRSHVVSLIAVFLALAVGVVLGGGPLADLGRASGNAASASSGEKLRSSYADAFAEAGAARLVGTGLKGRSVALVQLPGADPTAVKELVDQVKTAGATIGGNYPLASGLLDPGQKSLVDTLGEQLVADQDPGSGVDPSAATYERTGQLLGSAIASTDAAGAPTDDTGSAVLQSLRGADLLGSSRAPARRAPLVLVVLGAEPDADDSSAAKSVGAGRDAILADLTKGLASVSVGTVVVGTTASGEDGQLARLRDAGSDSTAATVDGYDSALGRVTAVLALERALTQDGGSFGASGADGAVPLG